MIRYLPALLIPALLLLLIKPLRRFILRAIFGVFALYAAHLVFPIVCFNYLGIALSSLLGIPGALSFVALCHIAT